MKSLIFFIIVFFISASVSGQVKDTFGVFPMGGVDDDNLIDLYNKQQYGVRGLHIILKWKDVQPLRLSPLNWPVLDSIVSRAVDSGYYLTIQTQTGQNAPSWMTDSSIIGRFYTDASGFLAGPYPDYRNPIYKTYWYAFMDSFVRHINTFSSTIKNRILAWHLSEGSTGDQFAYKGEPLPGYSSYAWTEKGWTDSMKKPAWDTGYAMMRLRATFVKLMINTGNNGEDLEYVRDRYAPYIMIKEGTLGHDIGFDGESVYYIRATPYSRSEIQGYFLSTDMTHPHKEGTALMWNAITGELKMLNPTQGWKSKVKESFEAQATPRITNYFNKYSQSVPTRGGIYFRDLPDFADTIRFPTNIWGVYINPDSLIEFNKRIRSIINDSGYAPEFAAWRTQKVTGKWISAQRVYNIRTSFPTLTFRQYTTEDPAGVDGNDYNDDFCVYGGLNYYRLMTQLNETNNEIPLARIGADTALYGRWAKMFDISSGECVWKIDIDETLLGGYGKDSMIFTVTYYDTTTTATWSLNSCVTCGFTPVLTVTNSGTNLWKTISVTIPEFRWRPHGYDISLNYVSGAAAIFGLIEVENISKYNRNY